MKHLLGIDVLNKEEIESFLERAQYYAQALEEGKWDKEKLKDRIVLHLFFENSTRTLTSFEIAAKKLGARVVNWNPETSSLSKGENFIDTIDTLCAMNPDAIVMRHSEYGAPITLSKRANCPVINGGDSWREHPTQALLDALTIRTHFGKIEGLCISIVGDIAHSRVANSNIQLLTKMGAKVKVIAPPTLLPEKMPVEGIETFESLEEGLPGSDIIMSVRIQKERLDTAMVISDAAYFNKYGLTIERLDQFAKGAMVMDPGPLVRGMQMADEVAEDPDRSLILKQVSAGIPTRMAVLDLVLED